MPKKTLEEWTLIRADFESGEYTLKALGEKWSVSQPSITGHRAKEGWINPKTGKPYGTTAIQKKEMQTVPAGELSAELSKERVDEAIQELTASIVSPDDESPDEVAQLREELETAKAELAAFKPVPVEWPVDIDTAARMLAGEIDDMVERELIALNRDRIVNGLSAFTVEQMDKARPGWSGTIREQILKDTVADLTRHATNEGPDKQKIDMISPNGDRSQIPVELNIDGGKRPEKLRARGWRDVSPQSCHRWNCNGPLPAGDPWKGYHSELHYELFRRYHPSQRAGVTTSTEFSI